MFKMTGFFFLKLIDNQCTFTAKFHNCLPFTQNISKLLIYWHPYERNFVMESSFEKEEGKNLSALLNK